MKNGTSIAKVQHNIVDKWVTWSDNDFFSSLIKDELCVCGFAVQPKFQRLYHL